MRMNMKCNNPEHLKGIIMVDMVKALFHNDEIKDKENFISNFSEILDMFEELIDSKRPL